MKKGKEFWLNIAEREIKTFCEVFGGYIVSAGLLSEINWKVAFSATGVAMLLCLITNLKDIKLTEV